MTHFTESVVEDAALAWLRELGYTLRHGPDIAPGELAAERDDYTQVVLPRRLRDALARLNPTLPADALEDAYRQVTRPAHPTLIANNRAFYRLLVEGVSVEYARDGRIVHAQARLVDFENPQNNDWRAVNQFTVIENRFNRRPDIVLFVNGLPLGVIELKNAADENATIWDAFNQLQTYKQQIPTLFVYNQALVISDGLDARIGTLTADRERFMPWRTIEGETIAPASLTRLEVLLRGVFEPHRFLDLLHHFIVFEDDGAVKVLGDETLKTIARELVETVRRNATIDWTVRETARAKLRVMVRRLLRKYGYPPDKQEKATQTVLEQAELIAKDWAG